MHTINIMEKIEDIEEKIENIKWLAIRNTFSARKSSAEAESIVSKSSGILGKNSPRGVGYENAIRRKSADSFSARTKHH